jgi:hypothetical protein
MEYVLCIEGGENGSINITDKDVIQKVDVKVYQNDKSANDRSDQLFGEVTIQGLLNDKSQKETKDIFDWVKKTDKQSVYKIVSIQVKDGEELIRDYYFKNMYCTSYQEIFDENAKAVVANSIGYFILELKQRKGSIDTIVVDC